MYIKIYQLTNLYSSENFINFSFRKFWKKKDTQLLLIQQWYAEPNCVCNVSVENKWTQKVLFTEL